MADMWGINVDLTGQLAVMATRLAQKFSETHDTVASILAIGMLDDGGATRRLAAMTNTARTLAQLLDVKVAQINDATYVGLPLDHFVAELEADLGDGDGSNGMNFEHAIALIAAAAPTDCKGPNQDAIGLDDLQAMSGDPSTSAELQAAIAYMLDHRDKWKFLGSLDDHPGDVLSLRDIDLMNISPDVIAATERAGVLDALDGTTDGVINHDLVADLVTSNLALDAGALELRNIALNVLTHAPTLAAVDIAAAAMNRSDEDNGWYESAGEWAWEIARDIGYFLAACASGFDDVSQAIATGQSPIELAQETTATLTTLLAINPELIPVLVAGAGVAALVTACTVGLGTGDGITALEELVDDARKGERPKMGDVITNADDLNEQARQLAPIGG
jgi:hypothetical protein